MTKLILTNGGLIQDYDDSSSVLYPFGLFLNSTSTAPAPVLTLPTEASITQTTVTVGCTNDSVVNGNDVLYYYISTSATAPSEVDLKAGTGSVKFGNDATPGTGINTFAVTGLTALTTYYTYFVQTSDNGSSNILESGSWATLANIPVLSLPTEASITQTTVTVGATNDSVVNANDILYYYISTSATAPSAVDLKAGTGSVKFGNVAPPTSGINTFNITGLSDTTTYYTYFIQYSDVGDSNILESGSWATLAPIPVLTLPTEASITQTTVTVGATNDSVVDGSDILYYYISTSATPPSETDLKNGTGATKFGNTAPPTTGINTFGVTGLIASTNYYTYFVQTSSSGSSNILESGIWATTANPVPVLSLPTEASITKTTVTVGATTDLVVNANDILYYYISTSATPPSDSDLKDGTGSVKFGNGAPPTSGINTFGITGLTASTNYYTYFLQFSDDGDSNKLESGLWTTLALTPPTLTLPTEASITTTTLTIGCTNDLVLNGNDVLYYYISTSATPPSAVDLKAGTGSVKFGNDASPSTGINTFAITGLTATTNYYSYFLQFSDDGDSNILESGIWTTLTPVPPVLTLPTEASITDTTVTVGATTDVVVNGNDILYYYISTSITPPSDSDLKDGTGSVKFGNVAPPTSGINTFNVTGLVASTNYYTYFIQFSDDGDSNKLESGLWATIAAPIPVLTSPTESSITDTTVTLNCSNDIVVNANDVLYYYVSTSATAPNETDLKAGTGAVKFGNDTTPSVGSNSFGVTGLIASTVYYAYYVQTSDNGSSNILESGIWTTIAVAVPSTVYDPFINMAVRMLNRYGQDAELIQIGSNALPDANKPWKPGANNDTTTTVKMAFFNETRVDQYGHHRKSGTTGKEGEEYGLMAALNNPLPKVKDVVKKSNGERLKISYINHINPDDTEILYKIGVNR